MPRASLHTLGCRLNNSETHIIEQKLAKEGFDIVPFGEQADFAVINTCTVTANADSKCRTAIRSFLRKNPEAFTAVVGCYSQMGYKTISEIDGVDLIVGNQEKLNVLDYYEGKKFEAPLVIRDTIVRDDFTINYEGESEYSRRANLKIQDGCNFMCSFCIIPFARGRARSREINNLVEEAKSLVSRGVKELILSGVNIGTYDNQDLNIVDVVNRLNQIEGLERIRISSIEPTTIPTELFDMMNDSDHALVPYLHIPLQSGSDRILKEMKRLYDRDTFIDFINLANDKVKDICIGTDIMVGFPGETDQDFEDSKNLVVENPVAYSHVFAYSKRDNTPAVKMDHVDEQVKKRRSSELRALSSRTRQAYNESFLGRELEVLFEDPKDDCWPGYTENYIRVNVKSDKNLRNTTHRVKLESVSVDFMEGQLV